MAALSASVRWCDDAYLDLKEVIIDFRRSSPEPEACTVHGETVEIMDTYENLGTVFDSELKFVENRDNS